MSSLALFSVQETIPAFLIRIRFKYNVILFHCRWNEYFDLGEMYLRLTTDVVNRSGPQAAQNENFVAMRYPARYCAFFFCA